MATAEITLTPPESQLRNLLLDVARYIDESKEIKEKIELRFAGGWVRDKLLNIPSNDIDTAINAMTGFNFGMKMKDYLQVDDNLKKHELEATDIKNLHTIAANPEKSKHLETATTRIFGFDVDFVNLRKEVYEEGNRNPKVEFGTPKEDAERRDATINALFYNLHSDQVEDFEGGLNDLDAKIIRTPLEPKQTFKDDPLRVLRLIRFASRLKFKIDAESEKYMSDPEILKALATMISRERIGIEVMKMLKGNDPRSSLEYIDRLGLYSTIFTDPLRETPTPGTTKWHVVYECLSQLKSGETTPGSIYKMLIRDDTDKFMSWILAAIVPFASYINPPPKIGEKKIDDVGVEVAREGIKLESKQCAIVKSALRNRLDIIATKDAVGKEPWLSERDTLGMKIRGWGTNWRLHAMFALLVEAHEGRFKASEWQALVDHVEDMDLMNVDSAARPVDGKVLSKALGVKPGIWMAPALDVCMAWRLRNPKSENIDGAIEEVRRRKDELKIPEK